MATTVQLRKMLDLKRWEMCAPAPVGGVDNAVLAVSTVGDGLQFLLGSRGGSQNLYVYNQNEDSWAGMPTPGNNGMAAAPPTVMCYHPSGPAGTATAGTSTTLTTALTVPQSLAGYTVRITGGTGAGQERTISASTQGANSVLTVSSAWTTTPDATSTYLLLTGRLWLAGCGSTGALRYYDVATNAYSAALATTGMPTNAGSNPTVLCPTPAYGNTVATGTATAGTTTTLTNSGKAWGVNQWVNYQVRITGGTGAGQVRTVASNTATALTVASAFSTAPDATSVYVLEPNDDYIYATQANSSTLWRYSISGNAWATITPGVARGANNPQWTATLNLVGIASDASWADETNIKNGRYLYSASTNGMQVYDIAANAWAATPNTRGFPGSNNNHGSLFYALNSQGGACAYADREFIYIYTTDLSVGAGSWLYRYNAVTNALDPFNFCPFGTNPQLSSGLNSPLAMGTYNDGGTTLRWLYLFVNLYPSPNSGVSIFGGSNYFQPFIRMLVV